MPIDETKLYKPVRRLITLRRIYAPYEGEDAELCALLKKEAKEAGDGYQITIDKYGRVKVSAPHDKTMKGETWELDIQAFINATQRTRDSLMRQGIVKKVTEYSGAYYGSVTVELF
jgi:hypothetical protein